ncbi:MAG: archease [Desulfurococcaceae archaeon]|jgi:SHS2 domain-containing protein|nr:archease [Desulfurococcaceae archaeon]
MVLEKPFEFLEHTADILVRAYGKTLEEALSNIAKGMFEIMTDTSKVEPRIELDIHVCGYDTENLIYRWLEELLYYHDAYNYVLSKFDVKAIKEELINSERYLCLYAKVYGEEFHREKHEPRTVVKAVTYHQMRIGKMDNIIFIDVVFDI